MHVELRFFLARQRVALFRGDVFLSSSRMTPPSLLHAVAFISRLSLYFFLPFFVYFVCLFLFHVLNLVTFFLCLLQNLFLLFSY